MSKEDTSLLRAMLNSHRRYGMTLGQRLGMWFVALVCAPIVQIVWEGLPGWWATLPSLFSYGYAKFIPAVIVLALGAGLFYLRERYAVVYGSMELTFAAGSGLFASSRLVGPDNRVDFVMAVCAAVYIAVRGYDNVSKGMKRLKEKNNNESQP